VTCKTDFPDEVPGNAGQMRESRNRVAVSPTPREAGNGWVLDAVFANGKQAAIAGFSTESEANGWLGSAHHVAWLRDSRNTFCGRSAVVIFEWLGSCALVLADVAFGLFKSISHRWWTIGAVRAGYRLISATPSLHLRASTYRRLLVAATALLTLVSVVVLFVAALATLGHSERPERLSARTTLIAAESPITPLRSREATDAPDPIAVLIDRVSSAETTTEPPTAAAETPAPQSAGDERPAGDAPAATLRHEVRRAAPPAIVGVWAPETGSCSARNARDGVLPAIISERGARAGATSCVFKEQRRTEKDWRVLANCRNGHEHWSSNVRLVVKGDRLIWTSKRGTQAYVRCSSNV
jgi:hypothetical protein